MLFKIESKKNIDSSKVNISWLSVITNRENYSKPEVVKDIDLK